MSEFKLSLKESIGIVSAIGGFFFQWYTLKMEIRESIIKAGFEKEANASRFESLENKISQLDNKFNALESKCNRIFSIIYADAIKPKEIKIESETKFESE
jgi:hypothetical protein